MDRSTIIMKLREHEPELKAAGIVRLSLFGSVARGDQTPQSDVDLMADFDKSKRYTLLAMGRLGMKRVGNITIILPAQCPGR